MALLTLVPEAVTVLNEFHGVATPWPSGLVQTRSVFPLETPSTRAWELSWQNMNTAEKQQLEAFYESTLGGSAILQWKPPGEDDVIDCRFGEDSLRIVAQRRNKFAASVILEALRATD